MTKYVLSCLLVLKLASLTAKPLSLPLHIFMLRHGNAHEVLCACECGEALTMPAVWQSLFRSTNIFHEIEEKLYNFVSKLDEHHVVAASNLLERAKLGGCQPAQVSEKGTHTGQPQQPALCGKTAA